LTERFVGQRVKRREDRRLITGSGKYVADIKLEGTLDAAFLRSPYAHAHVRSIDTQRAARLPGVVMVVTAVEIAGKIEPFTRFVDQEHTPRELEEAVHPVVNPCPIEVLASDRVRYVGQALAVVVAESRYLAEDALEAIEVMYEPIDVLTAPDAAMRPGAIAIHDHLEGNVQAQYEVNVGDVGSAFSDADRTISLRVRTPRVSANPIETRGVLASYDSGRSALTMWVSTQVPFMVRTRVSEMIHLPEDSIRVIAPEVGGGFGPKVNVYPEEILTPYLAKHLGRPVRWIEDRREHLLGTAHSRDQVHEIEVACTQEGQITAVRDDFLLDCGAYNPFSLTCAYNTGAHLRGPYAIPNYQVRGRCVLTNKMPNVPYRGAGRPEAVFTMDRIIDEVAHELDIDPAEVRFRNLISPEQMPYDQGMLYRDGSRVVNDSGDYPAALRQALEMVHYDEVRARQRKETPENTRIGVGLSSYIEGTGIGPFEGALLRVDESGHVVAQVGSSAHGQSHETTLGQICADAIGVAPDQVTVRTGDTGLLPHGVGTFASRSAVAAGTAVLESAKRVREKILAVASELLEVAPADLLIEDGQVWPQGAPSRAKTFRDIARAAAPGPRSKLSGGIGLEASYYFVPRSVTFAYGVHAAVVEVDPEVGSIDLLKYVVVHDCGKILNPTVVEGQIHGGVAQGIGCALYEEFVYGEDGQPLTSSFMDYLLPTAAEVPHIDQAHQEFLSDRNPLGVKGVGEGGAISPPAAIANALADAFGSRNPELLTLPLTPGRVWEALKGVEPAGEVS
jgi:carbon-monoxide dehydrogenase large subunit